MENAADQKVEDGGSMDRISNLPKEILNRILYFLPKGEAAQTCVLSKSWRFLWRKRLRVSLSERSSSFSGPHRTRLFVSHVNNALQVHLDYNHRIEVFRLLVIGPKSIPFVEKWISMLTAIGVRELFLSILPKRNTKPKSYIDVLSVFVNVEYLTRLHLFRCNLGPKSTSPDQKILFNRLRELSLCNVNFKDKHIFDRILSSCPLITTMSFEECKGLKKIKLLVDDDKKVHKYLNNFTFINKHTYPRRKCSIEIDAIPTLEIIHIRGSRVRFHGHKFDNLKHLYLYSVSFSSNSFDCSLCYEFPCLETLYFIFCSGWELLDQLIHINAPKLSSFLYGSALWANISITFTTPMSRQCKSKIALQFLFCPKSWFISLSWHLQVLGQSEICLVVSIDNMSDYIDLMNIEEDTIDNLGAGNCEPPVVLLEELRLTRGPLSTVPSLLNGLFSICRPRIIAQQLCAGQSKEDGDDKELIEFLFNFLMKRSHSGGNQELFAWQEDLVELRIECFDKSREQWQPTKMSECGALPESNRTRFRLRLKWSNDACESSSKRRKLE